MRNILVAILLVVSSIVHAESPSGVWRSPDGTTIPQTEARRSVSGFGVWLVITSDSDWAEKWETPSWTSPHFTEAREVARGSRITTLIFFANPKADDQGNANVLCDIKVIRPDGSFSANTRDAECMHEPLRGDPANVRLGAPVIVFVSDASDPAGTWRVEVVVKDMNRPVEVPVSATFQVLQ
jgi:hypothetical protein